MATGRRYRRYHEIKPPGQPGRAWPNLTQVKKEAGRRGVVVHYLNHLGEYVPFKWIVHKDAEREAKARLRNPNPETQEST